MFTTSIVSFKGGVGKTTCAVNLAHGACLRGARTLLIELDAQGSATENLTGQTYPEGAAQWLMNQLRFDEAVVRCRDHTSGGFLDLVPGEDTLEMAELWLTTQARTRQLLKLLSELEGRYDLVIIDTPPARGFRSKNAIIASDLVITPFSAEPASFRGPRRVIEEVEGVMSEVDAQIDLLLLPTQFDGSNGSPSPSIVRLVEERFGTYPAGRLLPPISFSKRLKRAHGVGQTMYEFTPGHETCRQFDHVLTIMMEKSYA